MIKMEELDQQLRLHGHTGQDVKAAKKATGDYNNAVDKVKSEKGRRDKCYQRMKKAEEQLTLLMAEAEAADAVLKI